MGKVMRGVNAWSEDGLPDGRGEDEDGYQGLDEVDPTFEFYDVVYMVDPLTEETLYFYCKDGTGATLVDPITDVGAGKVGRYWVKADNFDFIATKVLIASNAFIDIFSGNAAYMYDNNGPGGANPQIVAGMQGGSTTVYEGETVNQVNFFAGSGTPQEAPFRVYSDGSFVATEGRVGGYNISDDGFTYYRNVQGSAQGYHSIYQKDAFEILWRNGRGTSSVSANVNPSSGDPILDVSVGASGPALGFRVEGSPAIEAHGAVNVLGDIKRWSEDSYSYEDVITFDAANSTSGYDDILRIVHCSQSDYDDMEYYGTLDDNTWYIITE
jgi:hypothetical protein